MLYFHLCQYVQKKKKLTITLIPVIPPCHRAPKHFSTPLLSQTTILGTSRCQPHSTSGEVRGRSGARARPYTGLPRAFLDPRHLSFRAKDILRAMMSFSLSLATLWALHSTLTRPAGKARHLRRLGKRPGGRGPSGQPNAPQSLWSGAAGFRARQRAAPRNGQKWASFSRGLHLQDLSSTRVAHWPFYPDSFNRGFRNHRARAPSTPFTYAPGLSNPS